jgi:hypothetical protein
MNVECKNQKRWDLSAGGFVRDYAFQENVCQKQKCYAYNK